MRASLLLTLLLFLPRTATAQDSEVRCRIVDAAGHAISNALIQARAVTRATGVRYGSNLDVDASARSDASGDFKLRGTNSFNSVTVTVEAPGYAKAVFPQLAAGDAVQELKLLRGASVVGTLLNDGRPLSGMKLGISDTERGSEIYSLSVTAETDVQGRFNFTNLPPKRAYFLYGVMESFRELGSLPQRRINVGADQTVLDVGDLNLQPAFSVAGRVQAQSIPSGTTIILGRDGAHDSQLTKLSNDGRFQFKGVPPEVISIATEIPGLRLSARNGSLFPAIPNRLLGRIVTNKTDLIVEFEHGPQLPPLNVNPFLLREEALCGIEVPSPFPGAIEITGHLLGTDRFTVIEGRFIAPQVDWFTNRLHAFTDGSFKICMAQSLFPAALLIEAAGFLPQTVVATNSTNLTVQLQKGAAPKGVVLDVNGKPASAALVYLTDTNATLNLEGLPLRLAPDQNQATRQTTTDSQGRFSFAPRDGDSTITVFDDLGFASVDVTNLSDPIRLQSWARVEGNLRVAQVIATNEVVRLTSMPPPYQWYPRELPPLSISLRTRTDANGHFVFERIPPMMMELAHSPQIGDLAPEPIEKTLNRRLMLAPGQIANVDLGGQGRRIVGQVVVPGTDGKIAWNRPALVLETFETNGPSQSALTNLLAKLQATAQGSEEEKAIAEAAYQEERRLFAMANKRFYETTNGIASLLAGRRYLLQFDQEGAFHADDVPPGKYLIRWTISNRRRIVAAGEQEVVVPPGAELLDLGAIKLQALPGK